MQLPALRPAIALRSRLLCGASRENLVVAGAVAIHSHALALERVRELVNRPNILRRCRMREVGRLRDRGIAILLEGGLHPDVPLGRDIVRSNEYSLTLLRHFLEVDVAFLGDFLH